MITINSPELHKRHDENERAYIYRIGQMHDNSLICKDDGVSSVNWGDLAKLFNKQLREDGIEWTESTYRKRYVEGMGWFEDVFKQMNTDKGYIDELDIKQREIQKERYKLQATKIETNRNLRHESRFDLFYENIKDAIKRLPLPQFENINHDWNKDKEYVLSIGDIHYGATFESENNSYSRDICKRRFSILLNETKKMIKQNNISKLKIVNVADTIQGILRLSDIQINDIPVVDCVVEVSRLIAQFLNQLSAVCEIEYYHSTSANHTQTRPLGSKASELATEDLERIIANYINDLLADNNRVCIISDLDRQYLTFDIFNFKAIILHGHQVKITQNVIKDLSNLHRTLYSYAFLGHRHSANEIIVGEEEYHNIEVLNCPSFIGSDPYADKLMVGSKAAAKVYVFDSVYGHIESKMIILN